VTSPFIRDAFERRAAVREEYEDVFWSQYEAAETATNGRMLNRRGLARGIDPVQLFRANATYRRAYASEELLDYWHSRPHLTFAAYERQRFHDEGPLLGQGAFLGGGQPY
jgi:hypothetical protein